MTHAFFMRASSGQRGFRSRPALREARRPQPDPDTERDVADEHDPKGPRRLTGSEPRPAIAHRGKHDQERQRGGGDAVRSPCQETPAPPPASGASRNACVSTTPVHVVGDEARARAPPALRRLAADVAAAPSAPQQAGCPAADHVRTEMVRGKGTPAETAGGHHGDVHGDGRQHARRNPAGTRKGRIGRTPGLSDRSAAPRSPVPRLVVLVGTRKTEPPVLPAIPRCPGCNVCP